MQQRLDRLLADRSAPVWELIRPEGAAAMAGAELSVPWYGQLMTRPQTIAYFCQIDHWLRHYGVDIAI
jgi:asparagine synthase (glutamine-hydrolysing)